MIDHNSPYSIMRSPDINDVTWTDGFWAEKWQLLCEHMIPSQRRALHDRTNAAYFPNFTAAANLSEHRQHFGTHWSDGDCYKYLEALTLIYAQNEDEALEQELDEKIAIISQAQEADGYISTNVQLKDDLERWTFTSNHELYNMGHLMTAASVHFRVSQKRTFLDVAIRLANYLYNTFEPRPPELAHFGWNPSNIMGLIDLYRVTADKRYLDLAGIFVDMRGSRPGGTDQNQDHITLRRENKAVGHAVTGPYLYAGAADVFSETGDESLFNALLPIWESATQRRMYITGGIGSHHYGGSPRHDRVWEAFGLDYDLPNAIGYNETCANIALAMWSLRMASLTAEARYSDIVERVMYNAGISGVSIDGEYFCYTNPLRWYGLNHELLSNDSQGRWQTWECYCCPVQVTRTLAHLHEWVYGIGDNTVWVHLYGGNQLKTTLPDGSLLTLEQKTRFPWDGAVEIEIEQAPPRDFSLHLRIPAWADGAEVRLNGKAFQKSVQPGTYLEIRRVWQAGDLVHLELPLIPKIIVSHPQVEETRNHVAVMRGPVVYCLESHDLPENIGLQKVYLPLDATIEAEQNPDLLGGVTTLHTTMVHKQSAIETDRLYTPVVPTSEQQFTVQMIPYFAWYNRGIPEMSVWLPIA